jgi:hypothetical protein
MIAMGCASAQMDHELKVGQPLATPPVKKSMDRGVEEDDDEDAWWKKGNDAL